MNSFLKAEWKTIVGIIVFGGAIFGWFYYQEILKLQVEDAKYQFTCLHAGTGFRDFNLGTSYKDNAAALTNYKKTDDNLLNLTKYESPDGTTILTFRNDKLSAIEFYPLPDNHDEACKNDFTEFSKKNQMINAPIRHDDRIDFSYDGLISVKKAKIQPDSADPTKTAKEELEEIGWIILPVS
ncbi:MAG: hypothetical protein IJU23_07370 [Proteobacteria bacterium]|nr:hypothetical protein [Pseudomonadota bacterium]